MARRSPAASFGKTVRQPGLTADVAAQISAEIASGHLARGARLPPEHVLAPMFGVSRATLREAIAALRREGLLVARQGSGTYVAEPPQRRTFHIDPTELRSIEDVLRVVELRLGMEVEAASLAAERRT